MNSLSMIFALATLFILTQSSPLQNISGHDITDGTCTNVSVSSRVTFVHVDKMAFPFVTRSETITHYGDATIFCITAENMKPGGTASISKGGVGHTYAVIYLESEGSHGLEFLVSIYASNVTSS